MEGGKDLQVHKLTMEKRQTAEVTGVLDVDSFDEKEILLVTGEGKLLIRGEKLHMTQLSMDSGIVRFAGRIDSMGYQTKSTQKNREPLLKRLLQ